MKNKNKLIILIFILLGTVGYGQILDSCFKEFSVGTEVLYDFGTKSTTDGILFLSHHITDSSVILQFEEKGLIEQKFYKLDVSIIDSMTLNYIYYIKGKLYSVKAVFNFGNSGMSCSYSYKTNHFTHKNILLSKDKCVLFLGELWYRYKSSISSESRKNEIVMKSHEFDVIFELYSDSLKQICIFTNAEAKSLLVPEKAYGNIIKSRKFL